MPEDVVLTTEQQDQQDDAAFAAGFDKVREAESVAAPAAKEAVNAKSDPVVEAPAEPAAVVAAPAPAEEMFHGMPVSKIKAAVEILEKLGSDPQAFINQRIDGKMGEVKRNWIPEALKSVSVKSGGFSPAQLARLKEDYPDLHDILAQDLGEIENATAAAAAQAPATGVTKEQLEEIRAAAVDQAVQQIETKALTRAHPNWKQTVNSPEFREFMNAKTPEELKAFYDSNDADFIGKHLEEFKTYKPATASPAAAPAATATPAAAAPVAAAAPDAEAQAEATRAAQASARRSRIAAAVAPKGVGAARSDAPDDDAAFEAGFDKVRGRNAT